MSPLHRFGPYFVSPVSKTRGVVSVCVTALTVFRIFNAQLYAAATRFTFAVNSTLKLSNSRYYILIVSVHMDAHKKPLQKDYCCIGWDAI